jgi:microcystin-dependent protein
MAQPYVGEIRIFAGNFAPAGWMFCDGQLLAISENETLFNLIGTTYGGDGQSTFALPNLQSRIPIHMGNGPDGTNYQLAEAAGVEEVTLTTQQMPKHNHAVVASGDPATQASGTNAILAAAVSQVMYFAATPAAPTLNQAMITPVGGSQPHTNFQPYLCLNFIISLFGIYPSPT